MIKLVLFIFSCTILVACTNKEKVPKKIIQPDKMGSILWDMLKVQSIAEYRSESDSLINKDEETKKLTSTVFALHKITPNNFDKSYNWYVSHPEKLKVILDSLQEQHQRVDEAFSLEDKEELRIEVPDTNRLNRNKRIMKRRTDKWWKNNYFKIEL